jgi:hypothetical protein
VDRGRAGVELSGVPDGAIVWDDGLRFRAVSGSPWNRIPGPLCFSGGRSNTGAGGCLKRDSGSPCHQLPPHLFNTALNFALPPPLAFRTPIPTTLRLCFKTFLAGLVRFSL